MIITKKLYEQEKALKLEWGRIKESVGVKGSSFDGMIADFPMEMKWEGEMEHFPIFRAKYAEMIEDAMKKYADKHYAPFMITGDDVKIDYGSPIDYVHGVTTKKELTSLSIGTGYEDLHLSGVVLTPKELDITYTVNVIDSDGKPVNLNYSEVDVIDAINGLIEIKTYKEGEKKW